MHWVLFLVVDVVVVVVASWMIDARYLFFLVGLDIKLLIGLNVQICGNDGSSVFKSSMALCVAYDPGDYHLLDRLGAKLAKTQHAYK